MLIRAAAGLSSSAAHVSHPTQVGLLAAGGLDPASALTIYGPIGIICVLLMLGWLVPKYAYDRVVSENERLKTLVEGVTPLVAKNSEVTAEAIALMHLLQSQIEPRQRGSAT